MRGSLYLLAERAGYLPLIFKESDRGFYTASDISVTDGDFLKAKKSGRFTKLYPDDGWYFSEAERLINFPYYDALFNEDNESLLKLFTGFMFSKGQAGDEMLLNEGAKKMLRSAALLEADMIRAKMRGDPKVILRRSDKILERYYDYYYSGSIGKKSAGYISRAAAGAFLSALSSLGFDFDNIDFNIK